VLAVTAYNRKTGETLQRRLEDVGGIGTLSRSPTRWPGLKRMWLAQGTLLAPCRPPRSRGAAKRQLPPAKPRTVC